MNDLLLKYIDMMHWRIAGIERPYTAEQWQPLLDKLCGDSDQDDKVKDLVLNNALAIMNMPTATPAMISGVKTMVINHVSGPSRTSRGPGIYHLITMGRPKEEFEGLNLQHAYKVSQMLMLDVPGGKLVTLLPRLMVPTLFNTEHHDVAEWLLSMPEAA